MEIKEILAERQTTYGDYADVAHRSQAIKSALRGSKNWSKLVSCQRETLEMVANKLARILEGDPMHRDGWIDAAGYLQLVVNYIDESEG